MTRVHVKKVSDLPSAGSVQLGDLIYVEATGHHYAKNSGGTLTDLGVIDDIHEAQRQADALAQAATDAAQAKIVAAPSTASSTGTAGQIAYDATHFYVCIATDTWVRCTLATW